MPCLLRHGLRNGLLVHVAKVERGLACGCVCPHCGGRLMAKKGRIREHHFAHEDGMDCGKGVETALHHRAKDLLAKAKRIWIPRVEISFPPHLNKRPRQWKPARWIPVDAVALEKRMDGMVPDVVIEHSGHRLLLEIKVTHGVDAEKLERIRVKRVSALEVDLSSVSRDLDDSELECLVVGKNPKGKVWLHHKLASSEEARLNKEREKRAKEKAKQAKERAKRLSIVDPDFDAAHPEFLFLVYDCPRARWRWRGRLAAFFIGGCPDCPHAVDVLDDAGEKWMGYAQKPSAVLCGHPKWKDGGTRGRNP